MAVAGSDCEVRTVSVSEIAQLVVAHPNRARHHFLHPERPSGVRRSLVWMVNRSRHGSFGLADRGAQRVSRSQAFQLHGDLAKTLNSACYEDFL